MTGFIAVRVSRRSTPVLARSSSGCSPISSPKFTSASFFSFCSELCSWCAGAGCSSPTSRRWPGASWSNSVGWICPLTPLENHLRYRAGLTPYSGDFVQRHLLSVMYPDGLTRKTQLLPGTDRPGDQRSGIHSDLLSPGRRLVLTACARRFDTASTHELLSARILLLRDPTSGPCSYLTAHTHREPSRPVRFLTGLFISAGKGDGDEGNG